MKRKDLLFLTLLLTQTAPVWGMEREEFQQAHPQRQPQFECIDYMYPDQNHPNPRGRVRILPQDEVFICDLHNPQHMRYEAILFHGLDLDHAENIPQNLGIVQERKHFDFQYLGQQYQTNALLPEMLPLQGVWDFTRQETGKKRDIYSLKLMSGNAPVHQDRPLVRYVDHQPFGEPAPEIPGRCYFDGNTHVSQERKRLQHFKSPRPGAKEHLFPGIQDNGELITHQGHTVIYVEPFPLGDNEPKETYRGKYEYTRFLDEGEKKADRARGRLIYSDGRAIYLPHVTQELWTPDDETSVGFFIASYKQARRIQTIPGHVLVPGADFLEGLYHLVSVQDRNNNRFEKWRKLGDDPHEVNLQVLSYVSSIPGMGPLYREIPNIAPIVHYDGDLRTLLIKGIAVSAHDINGALQVHQSPLIMNIWGLNNILLNQSITCHGTSCSFIAPEIMIPEPITINLKGIAGQPGGPAANTPGADGLPGGPGGPGGNLFIKAELCHGFSHLTANLSGGDGGQGGNGAKGADGANGVDGSTIHYTDNPMRHISGPFHRPVQRLYNGIGSEGQIGENGGKPGQGGKQGLSGLLNIEVENAVGHTSRLINAEGKNGNSGTIGEGGKGGKHGIDYKELFYYRESQPEIRYYPERIAAWGLQAPIVPTHIERNPTHAPKGNDGVGVSDVAPQDPVQPLALNRVQLLLDYKAYQESQAKDPNVAPSIKVLVGLQ